MFLKPNDRIAFFGDSITEWGRLYPAPYHHYGMGFSYAAVAFMMLSQRYPGMGWQFFNRGVSGNRVADLLARLDPDVVSLHPNVVSILIGVNDVIRAFDNNEGRTVEQFEAEYRRLLTEVREKTSARLIVIEPFLLDFSERFRQMRRELNPRIDAIRALARAFGALYIPFNGPLAVACCRGPVSMWTDDGVHLLPPGQGLLAEVWMDAVLHDNDGGNK